MKQNNEREAFEAWVLSQHYSIRTFSFDDRTARAWEAWQAATQASESEINSLKQRIEELEAEVASCHKQIELDDGYMLDFKCHINSLRDALSDMVELYQYEGSSENTSLINAKNLLTSTDTQSIAEHDNAIYELIANKLDNHLSTGVAGNIVRAMRDMKVNNLQYKTK